MARNRSISPDFWTRETVIDCTAMTRLLFIGLWNFADDFGVQPLRPRTIRMQVFPGDELSNDTVRAMIKEPTSRNLVRIHEVDEQEYVSIADWEQFQRVGKHAGRRYPPVPSPRDSDEKVPNASGEAREPRPHALSEIVAAAPPKPAPSRPRPTAPWKPSVVPERRPGKSDLLFGTSHLITSQLLKPPGPVRLSNAGRAAERTARRSIHMLMFPTEQRIRTDTANSIPRPTAAGLGMEIDNELAIQAPQRGGEEGR
jgi:hypothetical protein